MKQITADEFADAVRQNPAWATNLTEPVEVTGHSGLTQSPITHLSPLLHFAGDAMGNAATFKLCHHLRIAEGTFLGVVEFDTCGIEQIGRITVTIDDDKISIATFVRCSRLKVAEGTFPGHVDFSYSGIERIGDLQITQPNWLGMAADFSHCDKLGVASGTYPGSVSFKDSGIRSVRKLQATRIDVSGCHNLEDLPDGYLDNPNVKIDPDNEMRLRAVVATRHRARQALKPSSDLLF